MTIFDILNIKNLMCNQRNISKILDVSLTSSGNEGGLLLGLVGSLLSLLHFGGGGDVLSRVFLVVSSNLLTKLRDGHISGTGHVDVYVSV